MRRNVQTTDSDAFGDGTAAMDDSELCLVMAIACDLMSGFPICEIRQLLDPGERQRFEALLDEALQSPDWPGLAGAEAATALALIVAMVDSGDVDEPGLRSAGRRCVTGVMH